MHFISFLLLCLGRKNAESGDAWPFLQTLQLQLLIYKNIILIKQISFFCRKYSEYLCKNDKRTNFFLTMLVLLPAPPQKFSALNIWIPIFVHFIFHLFFSTILPDFTLATFNLTCISHGSFYFFNIVVTSYSKP